MMWWHAAAWGLAGGMAAGLGSLMMAVAKSGFTWPWRDHGELGPRLFVLAGGLVLGALVAAATHDSMNGAWPAFAMGVGAPATVRGLLSGIEVAERSRPEPNVSILVEPAIDVPYQELREEGVGDGGR